MAGAELTPTAVRELLEQQSVLLRLTVHELRRPLAIMDGYLSIMRDGSLGTPPEPEQAEPQGEFGAGSENGPYASHRTGHVPTAALQQLYGWVRIGATVVVESGG